MVQIVELSSSRKVITLNQASMEVHITLQSSSFCKRNILMFSTYATAEVFCRIKDAIWYMTWMLSMVWIRYRSCYHVNVVMPDNNNWYLSFCFFPSCSNLVQCPPDSGRTFRKGFWHFGLEMVSLIGSIS